MADSPTIHLECSDDEKRTHIRFGNGDSEFLVVTALGNDLYRLEQSSLLGEAYYRDVISTSRLDDGDLLFLGIEKPSGLVVQSWVLSLEVIDSIEVRAILEDVVAVGGNWEQVFGGVLIIHTPAAHAEDFSERIIACADSGK